MSVTAAAGFQASGVAAGIKANGALDVSLVVADTAVPTAAVFTVNTAAAAPVQLSRAHLSRSSVVRAVVLNSGCANAATGRQGDAAAEATAAALAAALGVPPAEILVCSTGTIGSWLPINAVLSGVTAGVATLAATPEAGLLAARGIMTTDTVPKQETVSGPGFVVGGMAKGAGMIRPDMATMLCVITTDAIASAATLDTVLRAAVDESFNALNIDGCASTNDTVILMASGASGVPVDIADLQPFVSEVCRNLAWQLAADAEGASRVVTLNVVGAEDAATARRAGRAMADSALVRAAFYGGDPNWGRLIGALGATDVAFEPKDVEISFNGVTVAAGGIAAEFDEAGLLADLEKGDLVVEVRIGAGLGSATVLTTDLTPDYVRFNGERS